MISGNSSHGQEFVVVRRILVADTCFVPSRFPFLPSVGPSGVQELCLSVWRAEAVSMAQIQTVRYPNGPSWDEEVVPALRKRMAAHMQLL